MTEPTTETGRALDLAWPGTHIDRLDWRERILAIEAEAAERALSAVHKAFERLADELDTDGMGLAAERLRATWRNLPILEEPEAER